MLKCQNLSYSYDAQNTISFPDFETTSGEPCLILGQSGVGKTTLLHLLGGLLRPSQGTIHIFDEEFSALSKQKVDQFRANNIGIIFQKNHFVQSLDVLGNLSITQSISGNTVDKERSKALLEGLNIGHKINSRVNQLSEGEKQRVNIARALINNPKIVLADEPTSALDNVNCDKVISLLMAQAKSIDASLLIVTHDNRLTDSFTNKLILS